MDTSDDGTIFTRRGGGGWYMTKKEYANFDLHLEIKLSANADTGIAFRNSTDTDPSFDGNQIQFVDAAISEKWPGDSQTGGIIGVVGPQKRAVLKPTGEWNAVDIVVKGDRLNVKVNGTAVLDCDLANFKQMTKQHPDLLRKTGHIGLQSWDGLVEFRNVKIKELP